MTDIITKPKFKQVFIVIISVWLAFFLTIIFIANDLQFSLLPSMQLQSLNDFGGSFNILTSLFTGLAFAGVIISIRLQSAELKTAISAFEGQRTALENQELDNKFFQMLHFFIEIKRNIKAKIGGNSYTGNEVFEPLIKNLLDSVSKEYTKNDNNIKETFKTEFSKFNNEHEAVKYYFLNLYQILNYIKRQHINTNNNNSKKLYTNMLRAQLSKNELILLAYNSIGVQEFTNDNYQKLIEEYAFFEHLQLNDFLNDNADKLKIIVTILNIYSDIAFGDNHEFIKEKNEILKSYAAS